MYIFASLLLLLSTALPEWQLSASFQDLAKRAASARESNRLEEAVELYQQALALRPAWGEGWWHVGTIHYEAKRFDRAREVFRRVVEIEPTGGPAWALLGLSEYALANYDEAFQAIERARTLGVGRNQQLVLLTNYHAALLLNRSSRFGEAREILLSLAAPNDQHPSILQALGLSVLALAVLPSELPPEKRDLASLSGKAAYHAALRQTKEAHKEYQELLQRYSTEPNVHYNYGLFLQSEDPEAALREFRREIEVWPNHVTARLALALEYLRRGDFSAALPLAEEAVALAPESPEANRILGRALLELGQLERALRNLEKAARLDPGHAQSFYLLARAYSRSGKKAEAEKARQEFLRLQGGNR